MISKKKTTTNEKNESDQFNSSFFLLNQSLPSFGKNKNYYTEFSNCFLNQQSKYDSSAHTISSTGQFGVTKNSYLCCRTFFTEDQTIPQPESMINEFKDYKFPYTKTNNDTLKKTICAFLNAQGGHIFLGIKENNDTKQHRVRGRVYNEAQKEQILKIMRTNAESIQPDIIVNNKMQIRFVPVKNSQYPYHYLLGRFVIIIKIYPGIRDEVYTVRQDEGDYIVCMRTQNEVLTYDFRKQPRKLLSIQKQRAQHPINQFSMMSRHICKRPEEGARLFSLQKIKAHQNKQDSDDSDRQKKEKHILSRNRRRCQYSSELPSGSISKNKGKQLSKTPNQTIKTHSGSDDQKVNCRKKNQSKKYRKQRKRKQKLREKKLQIEKNKNQQFIQKTPYSSKERKQEIKIGCYQVIQRYYNKNQKITDGPEILNKSMDASYQKSKNLKFQKQSKGSKKADSRSSSLKSQEISKQTQVSTEQFFLRSQNQIESKSMNQKGKIYSQEPRNQKNKSKSRHKRQKQSIRNASTINDEIIKGIYKKENYKKNNFLQKLYHFQKFHKPIDRSFILKNINLNSESKKNYQSQKLNIKQFVSQLLAINHPNHRFFVFQGFSPKRISIILEEFTSINEYNFMQMGSLLLYRFNKETNQNLIKNTLTRAIHIRKKPRDKLNRSLGNIEEKYNQSMVYPNTRKKKDKLNNFLDFKQEKELADQYDSQHIGNSFSSTKMINIENKTHNGAKKHLKRIFKASIKIKIQKYNKLPAQVKQKIEETISLIDDLCQRKSVIQLILSSDGKQLNGRQQRLRYSQQSSEQEKESAQEIQFINLYYSLLAYLEMRNYNVDMIFC